MGDDSEWLKLPTDEKVIHKAWKARIAGYEECLKLFGTLDEKSPEFGKFLGSIKKMVCDTNAIAQEKALEAVLLFVENAHVAPKTAGEVCSSIVQKCLNSSRAKTKERALELLMLYIEIEQQAIVQEELLKGVDNKQPKIAAGCVLALTNALRDFGNKIMPVKPMIKPMQSLLTHRDKVVRDETKQLVIQMWRWVGQALKPQLASLKPVQISELEAEFEKLPPPGKCNQARFLRSQQDLKAKAEAAAAAGSGDEEDEEEEEEGAGAEVDPYELMDPVDILSKIPKDFYDKIEAKKWQERREALEAVEKLAEAPKLENGDYGDLMRSLKKVVAKDTNIMLVTLAAKITCRLATGLRKKFAPYANQMLESLLEKFREKKITVVTVLRETVDAIYNTTTLDAISETVTEMLSHKTPSVKAETALFLSRCFQHCTTATLPKKLLKMFIAPLIKNKDESDVKVRESAFEALGTAMKVITEKAMMPFIADVDPLKLAKIKEAHDKAVLYVGGKPKAEKVKKEEPKPAAAAAAKTPGPKTVRGGGGGKPKPTESSNSTSSGSRPGTSKGAAAKKGAKGKKGADVEEKTENALSDDAVDDKIANLLPADTVSGLANPNWKERLASMEKFTEVVKMMEKSEIPTQACVRSINKKPGLKETNFQVLKLRVDLIAHLALNSNFSKRSAEFCLTDLVDKVGDVKNGGAVKECLSCIAEACGLEHISQLVIVAAFEQKNPKNQSESLVWLASAIKEFGFKVNIKPMIQYIKKAFQHTNPAVRTAAIAIVGIAHMYMGPTIRVLVEDEKPALLQQIDAEIEKFKGEKPPAPIRGIKAGEEGEDEEEDEDDEGGGAAEVNIADLVPRNDISAQLTEDLMTMMADKNWKIRKEALEKVMAILNEAKFISANIGPLPESLKLRLGDSNKILQSTTLGICTTIASAMGPNVKQHVRIVGPGIVGCMTDSKPMVRNKAVECLNGWVEQSGMVAWVEAEIFSESLKIENPFLRTELLGWLAEKLPGAKKLPVDEMRLCIPLVFTCLEDRNGDVRKKAQEALMPIMIHTGPESMMRAASKLKASSKDTVIGHLEKAKAALPAKPVKAKKAAPVPAAASPVSDESDEAAPVVKGGGGKAKPGAKKPAAPAATKKKPEKEAPAKAPATSKKKKGEEEEDSGPALKVNNFKEQRFKEEKTLKVLKWNFTQPRLEFVEQLKTWMEKSVFSAPLMTQLWHADFKQQIKALETLSKCVDAESLPATTANLDLILKWITLRFFDTNTSVLLKILEYLQLVLNLHAEQDYHMPEMEAIAFIPYLVDKVGDSKENIRRDIRTIFKLLCRVYPSSKMFQHVLDGLKSKNSKQRTECLEELGTLIDIYGINVCQPSVAAALKAIAGFIGDRDKSVRSAALNTCVSAHAILGENIYKYIGKLNDKDMDMLEERIKRAVKSRPASAAGSIPEVEKQAPKQNKPKEEAAPRPAAGRGIPAPGNRSASVKREFQLDLDNEDDNVNCNMPQLIVHDLDVMEEPLVVPKRQVRPPSPSSRLLGSESAKSAIDLVISQIASNDIDISYNALAQVDEVLKKEDKHEVMESHVDQLLVVCSLQLRMTYSKHMADDNTSGTEVVKIYRSILAALITLLQSPLLARKAGRDVLRDLVFTLITVLLDTRLGDLEEGPQVIRSVNVVVIKIVENADHTNIMSALIKLLHESVSNEMCSAKFLELIMKCLWKMIRLLPKIIDGLAVERTLYDLHSFLHAFPSQTWKQRTSDIPLRTVKTILHSLAKLKGNKIMSYMTLIENPQESELEAYLQKVLKTGLDTSQQINGSSEDVKLRTPKSTSTSNSSRRLSKTTHDMLAEIFKKIGSKENTKEGLNDLYDFKLKYPEADLEPFLKKSSQVFQNYIERGLKNIEVEREGKLKLNVQSNVTVPLSSSNSGSVGPDGDGEAVNPSVYMERLKALRAKCGLDKQASELSTTSAPSTSNDTNKSQESLNSDSSQGGSSNSLNQLGVRPSSGTENEPPAPQPTSTANLMDLKKRLEQIKKASAN